MSEADFVLSARWIIPVIPAGSCLEDHAVVVRGGRIADLLPRNEALNKHSDLPEYALGESIVTAGFVNSHGHAAMTLLRGYSDDRELMDWLENHIWPAEGRLIEADFVHTGTTLAIAEMISTGTTCAADTYFFPDAVARACKEQHFRAQVCMPVIQFPNAWASTESEHIIKAGATIESLAGTPLVTTAIAPHAPYTVTDEGFERILNVAESMHVPIHLHLHETATEVSDSINSNGVRPFERMRALGLFGPNLQTVHMTQLDDAEIALLAETGTRVAHCPESNMKLASGFCRVPELLASGVNVSLGTDGAASNNNLDMLEEMRSAALIAKGVAGDATVVDAATALAMATINGARMMGLEHEIGSIEVGKSADLIAVDVSAIDLQPVHNPLSHLVYACSGRNVSHTWIAGKMVQENHILTHLDVEALRGKVNEWARKVNA